MNDCSFRYRLFIAVGRACLWFNVLPTSVAQPHWAVVMPNAFGIVQQIEWLREFDGVDLKPLTKVC